MSPFFEIIPIFEGFLQGNLFDFLSTYDRNQVEILAAISQIFFVDSSILSAVWTV